MYKETSVLYPFCKFVCLFVHQVNASSILSKEMLKINLLTTRISEPHKRGRATREGELGASVESCEETLSYRGAERDRENNSRRAQLAAMRAGPSISSLKFQNSLQQSGAKNDPMSFEPTRFYHLQHELEC